VARSCKYFKESWSLLLPEDAYARSTADDRPHLFGPESRQSQDQTARLDRIFVDGVHLDVLVVRVELDGRARLLAM
jgi:hypothetical protein